MSLPDAFPGMKPGDEVVHRIGDHEFRISATHTRAIHSDRVRYFVVCVSCGDELVHPSTSGPIQIAEEHVRNSKRRAR